MNNDFVMTQQPLELVTICSQEISHLLSLKLKAKIDTIIWKVLVPLLYGSSITFYLRAL